MTNLYSWPGAISAGLITCATCAYVRRVPRLKAMLFSEKRGAWGALYKASVIGTRLHWQLSLASVLMAFYLLFFR